MKSDNFFQIEQLRKVISLLESTHFDSNNDKHKKGWKQATLLTYRCMDLDARSLRIIEQLVGNIYKNGIFIKRDLKSAYHQIPILDQNKKFKIFEADTQLYQFKRIPLGVTNGQWRSCYEKKTV